MAIESSTTDIPTAPLIYPQSFDTNMSSSGVNIGSNSYGWTRPEFSAPAASSTSTLLPTQQNCSMQSRFKDHVEKRRVTTMTKKAFTYYVEQEVQKTITE